MALLKNPNIGLYGPKTRALQKRVSYEKISLTWKTANVFRYLGSRKNASPAITDVDTLFQNVADRAYDTNAVEINIYHEPLNENPMDLSRFGIINPLGESQIFRVHVNSFEADALGRYMVPGDVFEIPFFLQDGNKAYFEVEDIDRKPEFENFYVTITAKPIKDTQEVEEIPDIPSNSDILDAIEAQNEAAAADQVSIEGVNANIDGYIATGYFVEGYMIDPHAFKDEEDHEDYDVRRDEQGTFLDDPSSEIF